MMNSSKFELEVIASGDFLDSDPSAVFMLVSSYHD